MCKNCRPAGSKRCPTLSRSRIEVVPRIVYADRLEIASRPLTHAVASCNGSTSDAHLLACAWTFDAGIWSHDRGFVGTGWPRLGRMPICATRSGECRTNTHPIRLSQHDEPVVRRLITAN
ncbi:hypothetical protein FV228_07200 [Methylobacterium sp. WL18]|nr:hypothetical protein FV228_07200 [Methylobacterium sp. WL18]